MQADSEHFERMDSGAYNSVEYHPFCILLYTYSYKKLLLQFLHAYLNLFEILILLLLLLLFLNKVCIIIIIIIILLLLL